VSLAGVKVGDRLVIQRGGTTFTTVAKVGRVWVETIYGRRYRIDNGRSEHGALAHTVEQWQKSMQAAAARDALRTAGVSLDHRNPPVGIYEALQRLLNLPPLPAPESFEVPR